MALFRKSGGFANSWRFCKNQADLQNLGTFPKIRRISKIQADFQNFPRYRRLQKIRRPYCVGSAESPAADFLLVWLSFRALVQILVDVVSLSCSPQVRDGLPACCFYMYLRALSRTVPAAYTGPTCQILRGNPKTRQNSKI